MSRVLIRPLLQAHGLKGANKTTNLLIDELLALFDSPSFVASNTSSRSGSSMTTSRPGKPTHVSPRKGARPAPYVRKLKAIETQIPAGKAPVRTRDTKARKSDKGMDKEAEAVLLVDERSPRGVGGADVPPTDVTMIGQLALSVISCVADSSQLVHQSLDPRHQYKSPSPILPPSTRYATAYTASNSKTRL